MDKLLDVRETAEVVGIDPATIRRHCETGVITHCANVGTESRKVWRINAVREWPWLFAAEQPDGPDVEEA